MKIMVSAGWRNTGEFTERQCRSFNDAFSDCPSFFDRARGDWSNANALVIMCDEDGTRTAPWHQAKAVWETLGGSALWDFFNDESQRAELVAKTMDVNDPAAPFWAANDTEFRKRFVAHKVAEARWADAPNVADVWADVARGFGFTVTREVTA